MIKSREENHPKDIHLELNRYAENTRNIAEIQVEEDHVKVFIQYFFLAKLLPDDFFLIP
jgi:hypothetical protein